MPRRSAPLSLDDVRAMVARGESRILLDDHAPLDDASAQTVRQYRGLRVWAPIEPVASVLYTMRFPIVLVTESNAKEHWRTKHRRAKEQRTLTFFHLQRSYWQRPALPLTITLTRIGPGIMDDDNVVSACKHVRDGIADWLAGTEGQGQDNLPGLTWGYAQRKDPARAYAIEITIERRTP